nr:hypothetical protein [Burkholderia sp. AU45388]
MMPSITTGSFVAPFAAGGVPCVRVVGKVRRAVAVAARRQRADRRAERGLTQRDGAAATPAPFLFGPRIGQ